MKAVWCRNQCKGLCLPRLCGRHFGWQPAELLWPTADTLLIRAVPRKGEVGGNSEQQKVMWRCMGSAVCTAAMFEIWTIKGPSDGLVVAVTPHGVAPWGRAFMGENSGISNLPDLPLCPLPLMNHSADQEPTVDNIYTTTEIIYVCAGVRQRHWVNTASILDSPGRLKSACPEQLFCSSKPEFSLSPELNFNPL